MSTLLDIRNKVRLLTKRPNTSQISDASILGYINTFYLYDFPQMVQTSDLFKNISFTTTPNVASYSTTAGNFILNLKDFKDFVVMTDRPIYLAGRQLRMYQYPENFYNYYRERKTLGSIGSGNGIATAFTYSLPTDVLQGSVVIGALDLNNDAMIARDVPTTDGYGRISSIIGEMRDNADNNIGNINYLTGVINITFPLAPAAGQAITYECFSYKPTIPNAVLFFDNTFTFRPVPDKVYEVKLQVRVQPTAFVNDADTPLIKEWWQLIAYGAAKKILEDSSDHETVARIMPEYDRQKVFVMRKTHLNKSKDRTSTIFTGSENLTDSWFYFDNF